MTTLALITGATRGIGLETARQLAQQNVRVIIGARDAAAGEKVVAELRRENLQAEAVQLDVTDSASITAAAAEIERRHGQLDVLINNAGIVVHTPDGLPSSQPIADWRRVFDTNLFGLVETTQAFLPLLRKSKAGRIVNVSSLLGSLTISETPGSPIYDMRSLPAYNVSKTAVNAWTVQLAWELRDTPIKVNAIHPGYVKTEMNDGGGEMEVADGARTSVALALIGAEGPHGKLLHAGEVLPW